MVVVQEQQALTIPVAVQRLAAMGDRTIIELVSMFGTAVAEVEETVKSPAGTVLEVKAAADKVAAQARNLLLVLSTQAVAVVAVDKRPVIKLVMMAGQESSA